MHHVLMEGGGGGERRRKKERKKENNSCGQNGSRPTFHVGTGNWDVTRAPAAPSGGQGDVTETAPLVPQAAFLQRYTRKR